MMSPDGSVRSTDVNRITSEGKLVPLIVQPGIWKPAGLSAALTIRTTYTRPNQPPPYEDDIGNDGLVRYKYRGLDPNQSDNRGLREAMRQQTPLTYFVGVDKGVSVPRYPVWLVAEDAIRHEFSVAVDEAQTMVDLSALAGPTREYVARLTKTRLHQPVFRTRVLRAYADRCAMCSLHHAELLDAAHIIPDGAPDGDPVVPNGLA